jgi:2-oxoglutarate dehydrogenase complex dihydrolipoamide succinyltransferase (E2) component
MSARALAQAASTMYVRVKQGARESERGMPTSITMPQLGESVSEGTVGRWLKQEGDQVEKDEPLVEIITDKITEEMPSPYSGILAQILVKENQTVKVGADIAFMETATAAPASAAVGAPSRGSSTADDGAPALRAVPERSNGVQIASRSREKVSPLARRLAQEHAIDLHQIQGSGEGGRVRKEDILAYLTTQSQSAPIEIARTSPVSVPLPGAMVVPAFAGDEVITPSPSRRAIAEHMVRSKHTSPHATTLVEVDMTMLAHWLDQHKEEFKQREGIGISYQTFAIKATVEALKEYPYLNASWTEDDQIVLRKQIHIGVSIALPDKLIVPVIHNADMLNLAGIARATSDLVTRARTNKLISADMQGATFTVNNPGVFGTLISMAIINQPNAAILTMDSVDKRPVVINDAIAIRHMMYMSLSFDHRILDGMTAAQFLVAVKRRLESYGPDVDVY